MNIFNVVGRKLGKRAQEIDPRTLKLADYLTPPEPIPLPPRKADYLSPVKNWPMFMNDTIGDCTIAAPGHMIQEWTTVSGQNTVTLTDADILAAYEVVGGYVPGDPTTDNGCVLMDVLRYWRGTGIGGHKITAFVAVDITNRVEVRQAIYLFGNVLLGLGLPITSQNPDTRAGLPCWDVPAYGAVRNGSPWSWGGHCVPVGQYSADPKGFRGLEVVTWGQVYQMTWAFLEAYADEAYVVLSPDWINQEGKSPTGFNLDQLMADLNAIK